MRNEGVTILQLVITIIIMIIILAIGIFYGPNVAREAKLATIYNEIKEVKSVFKELYILNKIEVSDNYLSFYDEIEVPKVDVTMYEKELGENPIGDYYYLDFTTSRELENVLGIERVENDYILNIQELNLYLVGGTDLVDSDGKVTVEYDTDKISDYYDETFVK